MIQVVKRVGSHDTSGERARGTWATYHTTGHEKGENILMRM